MSDYSISAFAEDRVYHDGVNGHPSNFLSDDQAFPPLSSTTTDFELIRDDVYFTGENTVWINRLSYAEAAQSGGIVHKTFDMGDSSSARSPASYRQHHPPTPKLPAIIEEYNDDDDDDCTESVYYDAKSLSTGKYSAKRFNYAQKLNVTANMMYHRGLDEEHRKLSAEDIGMTLANNERIREAKELVDGCDKIMKYREPDISQYSYKNQFHNRFKVKDWHTLWRQCVLRAYKDDPVIERLYQEFESYIHRHGLPLFEGGPCNLNRTNWKDYHYMKYMIFRRLRVLYSDIIDDIEGLDSNISEKEIRWILRSTIPGENNLDPRATRAQCAYAILDELHG